MRVLFVSIALPPKNDPESLQSGKYLKYLSKVAQVDTVSSSSPTLWMETDRTLSKYTKEIEQTIQVTITEPKYWSILMNKYFRKFLKPDTRFTFHKRADHVISKLKHEPDIIYSRGYPLSSLYMGYKLKSHYKKPWVIHLSDPWVPSPLFNYDKSRHHIKHERLFFSEAAAICLTSPNTVKLYKERYPEFAGKFHYFPNCFDPDDIPSTPPPAMENKDKYEIIYTGSLTGSRSLSYLCKAFKEMKKANHSLAQKFQIIAAGRVDRYNQKIIQKHPDLIKHLGLLPVGEAQSLQRKGDLLLAVDFKMKNSEDAVYFPSKLLDYFILNKPIMAITTPASTTEKILSDLGHHTVSHDNTSGIISYLEDFAKDQVKKDFPPPERFSAPHNVNLLNTLLQKICQE